MSAIPTVTLYGERGTAVVNEADVQAWLDAGWSREPFKPATAPDPGPVPEPTQDPATEPGPLPELDPAPAQAKKGKA